MGIRLPASSLFFKQSFDKNRYFYANAQVNLFIQPENIYETVSFEKFRQVKK